MGAKRRLGGLQRSGYELLVVSQVLKMKAVHSPLDVMEPPRQISKPVISSAGQRRSKNEAEFFHEHAAKNWNRA